MKKINLSIFLIIGISLLSFGQNENDLIARLQGIRNNDIHFFNVDGIEITTQKKTMEFKAKSIVQNFKSHRVKEKELAQSDSRISLPNFLFTKEEAIASGLKRITTSYFIGLESHEVIAIVFSAVNERDLELEKSFIDLAIEDKIPSSVFTSLMADSLTFAGRKMAMSSNCQWMGVNNMQCPYSGQMNWSLHKDLNKAQQAIDNQFTLISSSNKGKIISDTLVPVLFEGVESIARKVIYDIKGINSVLVGMTGAKTLTIYFVASPVRNYFVSCVMSFWNNDRINPGGLPALLEKVMTLK